MLGMPPAGLVGGWWGLFSRLFWLWGVGFEVVFYGTLAVPGTVGVGLSDPGTAPLHPERDGEDWGVFVVLVDSL